MRRVALKGLLGRKLRAALTAIAIVLGVAMVSGTYVLTDTIKGAFTTIFTQSYKNSDAVITAKIAFTNNQGNGVAVPSFPASLLDRVHALPAVEAAVGGVSDAHVRLVGRNGKAISTGGAPNLAFSVDPAPSYQKFNPLSLTAGSWPQGPGEVAIDKATADKDHYAVGDMIGVEARGPVQQYRITGIAKFTTVSSIGGATMAIFDVHTAQQVLGKPNQLDVIRVQAKSGVAVAKLLQEIRLVLPAVAQVRSASQQAKQDLKQISFISILQKILLAFGGIALFVGAFVIANTLSITVAQRAREFATLRTLGATRRQVLTSVVLEALVIGVLGSVVGLFAGLGLAKLLNSLFVSVGIDLPQRATVFATRTIVVSLAIGIVITLLASLRPALRATRVPPIAAVREGAVLPPSRLARFGLPTALVVLALGIVVVSWGVLAHHVSIGLRLLALGGGTLLLFFGVALVAPKLVPPLASVLGWPGMRIGGAAGGLARENAMRNPSRTASTAAALMIGLALVTFVAVLGQGLRSSFESAVDQLFVGDYALTSSDTFTPLTVSAEQALRNTPGVLAISGIRAGSGRYAGGVHNVTAVDSQLPKVINIKWKAGNSNNLGRTGAFVDDEFAKSHHLVLGSPVALETPTGKVLNVVVRGIFAKPKGGSPFAQLSISNRLFDANYAGPKNEMALVNMRGGVSLANTKALEARLTGFPDAKIQTRDQFKTAFEKPINMLLNLLYVLLGFSVIISLFGIVNTLVLTVFERTRELGMLRAIGMTRRQVRRMIRYESVVTALIGAALGIVVGIFLALLVTHALSDQGFVFQVPVAQLIEFVIAAIIAGILAAILPARRAAKLNVLDALQYE
ncbi:MAG: ABC transporter permease [Gaiellaceae bacterium]